MPWSQLANVVREDARVDGVEGQLSLVEPAGERAEVAAICALRRLGQATVLEEAFDCLEIAHASSFRSSFAPPSS